MSSRSLERSIRCQSVLAKTCGARASAHSTKRSPIRWCCATVLRDLYKKHHWQVSGATFYRLHLLFDKHYAEQVELMDGLAERISSLGGVPLAAPHDVAEVSTIVRPPKGARIGASAD